MKKERLNTKKIKLLVIKELFFNGKRKARSFNLNELAFKISRKKLITSAQLEKILNEMKQDNFIELFANPNKKDYNYNVKLKLKGEYFYKREQTKTADFFVGLFVYTLFFVLIVFLIWSLKNIFV